MIHKQHLCTYQDRPTRLIPWAAYQNLHVAGSYTTHTAYLREVREGERTAGASSRAPLPLCKMALGWENRHIKQQQPSNPQRPSPQPLDLRLSNRHAGGYKTQCHFGNQTSTFCRLRVPPQPQTDRLGKAKRFIAATHDWRTPLFKTPRHLFLYKTNKDNNNNGKFLPATGFIISRKANKLDLFTSFKFPSQRPPDKYIPAPLPLHSSGKTPQSREKRRRIRKVLSYGPKWVLPSPACTQHTTRQQQKQPFHPASGKKKKQTTK